MFDTTKARDQVSELAPTRPAEAFRVARQIADPWFAVQALAWVGRYAPADMSATALGEARATARAGRDAYQRSAVLAWPIRAAIETANGAAAAMMLAEACALLPKVRPAASRAEAAGLLLEAAFPGGRGLWEPILAVIEAHCPPGNDWRTWRLYRTLAHIVAVEDPEAARRLVAAIPPGKARDRAEKELANGAIVSPRAFFGGGSTVYPTREAR
ncbi:MAG: hypothetical protein SFW09_01205 [Hyphomicrobiaceae bacterium]|nr:hypothetical protein [Hyphomicrobiaceae bacterium]